jgi:hypothetical protein
VSQPNEKAPLQYDDILVSLGQTSQHLKRNEGMALGCFVIALKLRKLLAQVKKMDKPTAGIGAFRCHPPRPLQVAPGFNT